MCYYSDLDTFNPIVFCGTCSLGTHQKCYGIEDLEPDFNCDRCVEYLTKIKRVKRKNLKIFKSELDKLKCIVCFQ